MDKSFRSSMTWVALVTTLILVVVACAGGDGATPGAGTPDTGTPTTGGTPDTGTPTTGETPGMGTPTTGETPGTGESPATGESPGAGTSPGPAPTFENIGGSVSIIGSWTDAEQESFLAMIEPWREMTGVEVNYVGTRDMQAQLETAIQGGGQGLPDVAGIPGPGLMEQWFNDGALKPLDFIDTEAYTTSSPALAELGFVDDQLAGIFFKAAVKGLIWYPTAHYDGTVPENWDAVMAIDPAPAEALWCVAFESGAASGWPGTDWIEDFVIRQSGPDVYDQWVLGEIDWSSPEIRQAFEAFVQVIEQTAGGGQAIVTTPFQDGGNGMFTDPPQCKFHHQASFMSDFLTDPARAGASPDEFSFFVMPSINEEFAGALTGGGDLFGMFNDTPQARSLIQYLITPEAQQIWAERGGFIAANTDVPVEVYGDEPSQKAAEALANASTVRFDGSDSMPGEMNQGFFDAMMDLAQNPGNLDSILQRLDEIQDSAYGQ